jgi:hypothetical protein
MQQSSAAAVRWNCTCYVQASSWSCLQHTKYMLLLSAMQLQEYIVSNSWAVLSCLLAAATRCAAAGTPGVCEPHLNNANNSWDGECSTAGVRLVSCLMKCSGCAGAPVQCTLQGMPGKQGFISAVQGRGSSHLYSYLQVVTAVRSRACLTPASLAAAPACQQQPAWTPATPTAAAQQPHLLMWCPHA